jgi:hypothetical protein
MLPVDAGGEALSNAVLYGVDARAAQEIECGGVIDEPKLFHDANHAGSDQGI